MLPSSYRRCGGDKRHPQFQLHRIGQLHRVREFFIGTTANVFHRSHCQRGFLHASTPVLNSFHCHRVHDPRQRPSWLGMCTNSDSHHCVLTFITPAPLSYRQHRVCTASCVGAFSGLHVRLRAGGVLSPCVRFKWVVGHRNRASCGPASRSVIGLASVPS